MTTTVVMPTHCADVRFATRTCPKEPATPSSHILLGSAVPDAMIVGILVGMPQLLTDRSDREARVGRFYADDG
jgi:hypothetical protein